MVRKFFHRQLILLVILVIMVALAACGGKKNKYVGDWYYLDYPEDVLIITKDKTFSYDGESGTISETEDGFILDTGWDSVVAVYTEYEGVQAIIINDDEIFVKDYEKANEFYQAKLAEEEAERIAYEEEARKKEEEERLAKEEEARELEDRFDNADKALASMHGGVLAGYNNGDENDLITVTLNNDGTCIVEATYSSEYFGTYYSYEGKIIRYENPGEFRVNVSRATYYYLQPDGVRRDEREETGSDAGYYELFITLIPEGEGFSSSKFLINGGADFSSISCEVSM